MSQLYLAPYIAPEFHLTHEQVGMLASVLAVTCAVPTLFFDALSDRFGRRKILIPAVFAFSLLSWRSGIAHTFHQLLLVRALRGIAEGPRQPASVEGRASRCSSKSHAEKSRHDANSSY
jgi:MFS family permease